MRFTQVEATAFGPLRNALLTLTPGLNVIHGPNEAGKSSWFAACYAALCGRRRQRGRGTADQADFKRRHHPWTGRAWSVTADIVLDSGTRLRITQDLACGSGSVTDLATGRPFDPRQTRRDLLTEGTLDAARLLGLSRDTVRSTIFVGQADVLRVATSADQLQEAIQRAATSESVDTTTEGALMWLAEQRQLRVGHPTRGQRPLRAATEALERAREAAVAARDRHQSTQQISAQYHHARMAATAMDTEAARLRHAQRWVAIDTLRHRVDQVTKLTAQLAADASPGQRPADEATVREVTAALAAFHDRGPLPEPPTGPDAAAITAELAQLPTPVAGDSEPRPEIVAARERLLAARTALVTHRDAAPPNPPDVRVPCPAERLRELASTLDQPGPATDSGLEAHIAELTEQQRAAERAYETARETHQRAERLRREAQQRYAKETAQYDTGLRQFQADTAAYLAAREAADAAAADRARARRAARRTGLAIAGAGGLLLGVGLLLVVLGLVGPGIAALVVGGIGAIAGIWRMRPDSRQPTEADAPAPSTQPSPPPAPTPPTVTDPGPPPTPPAPDTRLAELTARQAQQQAAAATYGAQQEQARAELADLGLDLDSGALRHLARQIDDATDAQQRREAHAQQLAARQAEQDAAVQELAKLLDVTVSDPGGALERFDTYAQACQERAAIERAAARRPDLQRALAARTEQERGHERRLAEWRQVGQRIQDLAAQITGEAGEESYRRLAEWLDAQEELRAQATNHASVTGRLSQLLDGETLADLEEQLVTVTADAGERPATIPADLDRELAEVSRRREVTHAQVAKLAGQLSAPDTTPRLAEAIEAEAAAESALADVEVLDGYFRLAQEQLELAKERAHATIAPVLSATIRPWLPRITGHRYVDLDIDVADLSVRATDRDGAVRDAALLSHGTTEQIFLLLRLGLAQHLADRAETAPFVLDDVTVQSDATRTLAVLKLLREVSADRQVILFTQEQEVVDWANDLNGDASQVVAVPTGV
ncbi:AAA family ATPase [Pilimelia columellifera]|uniref:YhaN AAA domain-containing protein n=1 Tax=Pilimelia columellifera subsp. columellifera TaxID=706583 RepID=A0ABP6B0P1_9ACTN